jgi:hypothetical protein
MAKIKSSNKLNSKGVPQRKKIYGHFIYKGSVDQAGSDGFAIRKTLRLKGWPDQSSEF